MRLAPLVRAILSSAVVVAGCAGGRAHLRRHTYPPNFRYIERAQLDSAMWRLAAGVNELDDLLDRPEPVEEARRARIAEVLAAMDAAAAELATHGRPTNHPLIAHELDGFRRALTTARASVESGRPNWYLVGSVSGACLGCHGPNG
jgi:hypothetical protein